MILYIQDDLKIEVEHDVTEEDFEILRDTVVKHLAMRFDNETKIIKIHAQKIVVSEETMIPIINLITEYCDPVYLTPSLCDHDVYMNLYIKTDNENQYSK